MRDHPKFPAYVALAAVCFFWGTTYLGIRMALETFPPLVLVATRYLLSGSILIGAAVAWAASVRLWRPPTSWRLGLAVWLGTLVIGMILRRTVFDKGTAPSFVVVATLFLGLFLLGWRLVARWVTGRRAVTQGA